jgi:hypothetical protein
MYTHLLQIVFLTIFKIVDPLLKMKHCTMECSEIGKKKGLRVVSYKILTSECSSWCTFEGIQKQMENNSWTVPVSGSAQCPWKIIISYRVEDCTLPHRAFKSMWMSRQFSWSVFQRIDLNQLTCLNETVENSGRHVFKPYETRLDRN